MSIWKEKFNSNKTQVKSEERIHLDKLEKFFTPDFFSDTLNEKNSGSILNWCIEAESRFGWSKKKVVMFLCTFNDLIWIEERQDDGGGGTTSPLDDTGKDCVCRWSDYCNLITAGTFPNCVDYSCGPTSIGCGWLLLQNCRGRCHE